MWLFLLAGFLACQSEHGCRMLEATGTAKKILTSCCRCERKKQPYQVGDRERAMLLFGVCQPVKVGVGQFIHNVYLKPIAALIAKCEAGAAWMVGGCDLDLNAHYVKLLWQTKSSICF